MFGALRSHKFYVPLITVAVSLGLFFVYYFFYVARERNDANERAFRLLRIVDDQLMLKYTKLSDPFGAALVAHKTTEKADSTKDPAVTTKAYLGRAFNGEISDIQLDPHCDGSEGRTGKVELELVPDTARGLTLRSTFRPDKPDGNKCSLSAILDYGAGLRARFQNVTQDYFDDILVATSSGEVFFQKNNSGLRITDLNALFPGASGAPPPSDKGEEKKAGLPGKVKPAPFQIASQVTNVVDVELAGARYKLYLQPAPLEILKPDQSKARAAQPEKVTLVVCGLWRADRLESEVVSIPYTTLIWGTLVVLAAFALLWPLLKVAYMSPAERLRRRHVYYLLSSALLVTALLTVIVLNLSYSARDGEESEEQLRSLANMIDENLKLELLDALAFMDALGQDESLHQKLGDEKDSSWNNFFLSGLAGGHVYPYFDSVSWVDNEGRQEFKVTVQPESPPVGIKDRPYFQDVFNKRHMMPVNGIAKDGRCQKIDCSFRFDSVYSRNTGELLTILAKPYKAPESWKDLPERRKLPFQVMSGRFKSLVEPMLPAGFGFAVVNREGIAQIHSIAARSGIENFFKESRQDPSLQALVRNALTDELQIDYMGRRHKIFVKPLPYLADPAPALIVFRDSNYFSTINVACFLVFTLLAALFSFPFLVGLSICIFRRRDYPLESMWPSHGETPKYVGLITACLCMTLAFVLRFSSIGVNETLIDILAMSAAAILLCFKPSTAGPAWDTSTKALVAVVILVIAGQAPAMVVAALVTTGQVPALLAVFVTACHTPALAALVTACHAPALAALVTKGYGPALAVLARAGYTPVLAVAVAVLYVVASLPVVTKRLGEPAHRRIKLQHAFLGTALSLVTVIVVLPCFGLFRISYDTVNRLALQNAQLNRRDQLLRHAENIKQRASEVKVAEKLKDEMENPSRSDWDRYDKAVFCPDPTAVATAPPGRGPLDVSWLQPLIAGVSGFFPSNRLGAELREVAQAPRDEWKSAQNGDDELLFLQDPSKTELPGVYPLWQLPRQTMPWMAGLAFVLALWLRYVIRKVFLTDLEDVPPLAAGCPCKLGGRNLLIIGDCDSGEKALLPAASETDVLDLEQMATSGDWKLPVLPAPATRIDHFEFDLENPETSLCKLQLLEQLRYVAKKYVILHSTVDPMFYLSSADAGMTNADGSSHKSPIQLDRWADVFNGFEKVQVREASEDGFLHALAGQNHNGSAQLVEMIRGECRYTPQLRRIGLGMLQSRHEDARLSKGQFVDVLLDRADSYYRVLWSTCTKEERMVLYQLAMDGWVNPKNARAIQQLQRRGVIRRGSGYRLMNDSLRRFVHNAERPEEVAKWEQEEGNSAWSAVKLALGTGLMMCGAWLIYAQQDIFQLGIGYLTALGTASGAVVSLTRTLRGKSGAA